MNSYDINQNYNEFEELIKTKNSHFDISKIRKAYDFAKLAHDGVMRTTGDPFISHPLETAKILAGFNLDTDSIVAGLLHDVIEDGGATRKDIVNEFGEDVAFLVDGVTTVSDIRLLGSEKEQFVENLRKMFVAMAKDIRVVLIKLADRLHNMRTLYALPKDKQIKIAKETIEIYAPLAERLGIGEVKGELEDICFEYLYPKEFKDLVAESKSEYKKAEQNIRKMKSVLLKGLSKHKIHATIKGRKKHIYSLWRKLQREGVDWDYDKVYDVVALRILVNSVGECYVVLGIIHSIYKPLPHKTVSDYIAQPKPNGYRSLHTKVFGPGNKPVEIQIRTIEMHQQAEHGVASHWAYSEFKTKENSNSEIVDKGVIPDMSKLDWVKELSRWQEELKDSEEFMKSVKFDALSHRNFIFSPKGDVYDLPAGATPVDFAAVVHTDLLNFIKSAKVNNKIVSLDYKLKSGDVVEIIKTKNPRKPNRNWLDFVKTNSARREINKHFQR